jgi:hypothetical protein
VEDDDVSEEVDSLGDDEFELVDGGVSVTVMVEVEETTTG